MSDRGEKTDTFTFTLMMKQLTTVKNTAALVAEYKLILQQHLQGHLLDREDIVTMMTMMKR